jgi:hypothetical protein
MFSKMASVSIILFLFSFVSENMALPMAALQPTSLIGIAESTELVNENETPSATI